jgi:glycosyltransferase involved in cell wall biosynthesis
VLEKAAQAAFPIVYSQFGKRMCENAGLEVAYVPHMVDTAHYAPGDQAAARARLGWPEDAFIAVMVAANKGFPARKNFCEQLDGFKALTERHADALLYLHTTDGEPNTYGGVNLRSYVRRAGLEGRVSFPDQYAVRMGMGTDYLRDVYQGADVLLSVSAGEGFGVPIVEAQSCGTPVIVGNWTAMAELCGAGWTIGKHEAHEVWTPQEASQWVPMPGAVTEALELAYHAKGGRLAMRLANRAREFAMQYDADHVAETYWRPTLDAIAVRLGVESGVAA